MEWVWCSESVQNQVKWASCFVLSYTILIVPVSAIQATLVLQETSGVSRTHCTWQDLLLMLSPGWCYSLLHTFCYTVNASSISPPPSHLLSLAQCTVCNKEGNNTNMHWGKQKRERTIPGHWLFAKYCARYFRNISSFNADINPLQKVHVIPTIQMIKWKPIEGQTANPANSTDFNLGLFQSRANTCFMIFSLSKYTQ